MEVPSGPTRRFPTTFIVTARTLRTVRSLVRIGMASRTIFGLHLGEFVFAFRPFASAGESGIRRRMARRALHLLMLAFEFKGRFVMIEGLARRE